MLVLFHSEVLTLFLEQMLPLPLVHYRGSFLLGFCPLSLIWKTTISGPNVVRWLNVLILSFGSRQTESFALEFNVFITDANYYSQRNGPCPFSEGYCCNHLPVRAMQHLRQTGSIWNS